MLQIAALALVTGLLALTLRKEQPVFAFLVSVCGAGGVLLLVSREMSPLMDLVESLAGYAGPPHAGHSAVVSSRPAAERSSFRRQASKSSTFPARLGRGRRRGTMA